MGQRNYCSIWADAIAAPPRIVVWGRHDVVADCGAHRRVYSEPRGLEERQAMNKPRAQQLNLRCRCGADGSPIPCKGGCDLICQRVDEREAAAVTRRLGTIDAARG